MNNANMGFNKFCGPAALSIITGKNTDECAAAISRINGKYKIKGVQTPDLIGAANNLGYDLFEQPALAGRSLFMTATMISKENCLFLVTLPEHYVVLEVAAGVIHLCDAHSKEPINLQSSARGMQRVVQIHKVVKQPPKPVVTVESSELHAEYIGGAIMVKRVVKYSDGVVKIYPNGTITMKDKSEIQDLSFKLMQLTDAFGDLKE